MKASSSLASAKETELRLLRILKERDDLVLSYHTALKELSKLATRIKDENHMLRTQLNMNDLSHREIVLALDEQVRYYMFMCSCLYDLNLSYMYLAI